MRITDQMLRKVFYINHVAKFAAAFQANHCSNAARNILYKPCRKVLQSHLRESLNQCRAVFYINHEVKLAAAYQVNHCINASASHNTLKMSSEVFVKVFILENGKSIPFFCIPGA